MIDFIATNINNEIILKPINVTQPHWVKRNINIYCDEDGDYCVGFNELYENQSVTETFKDLRNILENLNLFDKFDVDSNTGHVEDWSGFLTKEELINLYGINIVILKR